MQTEFSIYIPRIHNNFTSYDICKELSVYGYTNYINIIKCKKYPEYNSAFVKFIFVWPSELLSSRNLVEDVIYRESNGLNGLTHLTSSNERWVILRNKSAKTVNNDSMIVDNIYGYGL